MPKHKKKFISKKDAITFHLVHRSQQDPLITDEKAPQHVLVAESKKEGRKKQKEEERKYGVFFDDDYDYLQHLRSLDESYTSWEEVNKETEKKYEKNRTVQLPSSVFASEVEEPVGLLNRAPPIRGPRVDLDPDIVAAMDEDFDFDDPDNILEDNFVELANDRICEEEDDEDEYDSELEDEVGSLYSEHMFSEEETKSQFTNYSMSSSVMRRNEQLTLLDDRFEKMFSGYEESEIGALDCEEIEGHLTSNDQLLVRLAEDFKGNKESEEVVCKNKILSVIEEDSSEEDFEDLVVEDKKEKWDCESILSTYSNIYNHPAKIVEPKGVSKIRVSKTTGIPLNVIGDNKLTASALAKLNNFDDKPSGPKSVISQLSELSIRSKDETLEEKKQRKQALKMYRRERRMERKANTEAFKHEKKRQEKVLLNQKTNLQGIKII